ncbi:MAG: hypothetical protein WBE34_05560 [Candidatus Nitrosopolaris sp.]
MGQSSHKGRRSQTEIANILHVSVGTINNDISYLREQAKYNIRKYVDEKLPYEYERCVIGLNEIIKETWITAQNSQDTREKIQALSLAKECYGMKLDLLTNATVVDDGIRFVAAKNKDPVVKATCDFETEANQLNDILPVNVMNDDLQDQQQSSTDNDLTTQTTT